MGWRTEAADGGGWGGEGVLAPIEYEWGKGRWRGRGEPCIQGELVSNARKFTNLAPVSNFYYITATLVGWG